MPIFPAYQNLRLPFAFESLTVDTQLAILVGWVSIAFLAGTVAAEDGPVNGMEAELADVDPRTVFFAGVALHAVGFALSSAIPVDFVVPAARAAGVVLALVLFLSGIYAASRVPDGPISIRLAGLVHSVADVIKLIMKEDFVPKNADRLLHSIAPMIALFPAFVTMAVLPFGSKPLPSRATRASRSP